MAAYTRRDYKELENQGTVGGTGAARAKPNPADGRSDDVEHAVRRRGSNAEHRLGKLVREDEREIFLRKGDAVRREPFREQVAYLFPKPFEKARSDPREMLAGEGFGGGGPLVDAHAEKRQRAPLLPELHQKGNDLLAEEDIDGERGHLPLQRRDAVRRQRAQSVLQETGEFVL